MYTLKKTMAMASLLAVAAARAGNGAAETVSEPSDKQSGSRGKRNGNRNSSLDSNAPDHDDDMMFSVENASEDSTYSVSISTLQARYTNPYFDIYKHTSSLVNVNNEWQTNRPSGFFPIGQIGLVGK